MAQKTIPSHPEIMVTLTDEETSIQDLKTIILNNDTTFYQKIGQIENDFTEHENVTSDIKPIKRVFIEQFISDIKQIEHDFSEHFTSDIGDLTKTDIENAIQEAINNVARSADMYQIFDQIPPRRNDFNIDLDNDNTDEQISNKDTCMYCTKYELVSKAGEMEPGDTIRFKRYGGVYKHFATVIRVCDVSDDESKANVTLVELTKVKKLFKTKLELTTKELNFSEKNIEKAIYTSMRYSREQIVQRAKEMVLREEQPQLYDLFRNNCEHKSNIISQNQKISTQCDTSFRKIKSVLALFFRAMCKFGSITFKHVVAKIVSFVTVIGAVITKLKSLVKKGIICLNCHDEQYAQLKVSLVFSLVGLTLSTLTGFHFATVFTTGILGMLLPFIVPYVYRRLKPYLDPLYDIPKTVVKDTKMVLKGDVITFSYHDDPHEGIVTEIHDSKCSETIVKLTVVHFPYPGFLGQYTVEQEELFFDLKKTKFMSSTSAEHFVTVMIKLSKTHLQNVAGQTIIASSTDLVI